MRGKVIVCFLAGGVLVATLLASFLIRGGESIYHTEELKRIESG
jgi:hypoxanthine phosphoribosyltransferase